MKDLVLLVADKNAQFALKGALARFRSIGIREIEFEFIVHPGRDGGARKTGPDLLSLETRRFRHALLLFDHEGCGAEATDPLSLEEELNKRLESQWKSNARTIVIAPELDVWMWGSNNSVEQVISWDEDSTVREWLKDGKYEFGESGKPIRPKEALEAALRQMRIPRSSALYQKLAGRISLARCRDESFRRLKKQLVDWFAE